MLYTAPQVSLEAHLRYDKNHQQPVCNAPGNISRQLTRPVQPTIHLAV